MDKPIEKKKFPHRYIVYAVAGVAALALIAWLILGSTASTMTIDRSDVTVSDVTRSKFDDYVRLNGQVLPPSSSSVLTTVSTW